MSSKNKIPTWWLVVVGSASASALLVTHELNVPANWADMIVATVIVFSSLVCFYRPWWSELRMWLRLFVTFLIHSFFAFGAIETGLVGPHGLKGVTLIAVVIGESAVIMSFDSKSPLTTRRSKEAARAK